MQMLSSDIQCAGESPLVLGNILQFTMLYVSIVSAAKKLYRSTQHIPRAEVEPQPSAYCSTQHIPRTEVEPQPSVSFHCHGIFFPFDDGYQRLPGA